MKKIRNYFERVMMTAILAVVCGSFLTACGSDDDDNGGNGGSASGGGTNAAIFIGEKNYGNAPYGYFLDNGIDGTERTGSFMFSNVKLPDGLTSLDTKWTYVSVRLPYDGGAIPVGKFSGSDVDMDFDINHNLKDNTVDLTGWSVNVSIEIKKSGDKYVIDVTASNLYTATDYSSAGKKSSDNFTFHYEGGLTMLVNSQQ